MKFSAYEEEVKETRDPVAFICGNLLYFEGVKGKDCFVIGESDWIAIHTYTAWKNALERADKVFYPGDKIVIEV